MNENKRVDYVKRFEDELLEIDKLQSTPHRVRDIAVDTLENALKSVKGYSATTAIKNGLQALDNIENNSLATNFKSIYSQMCVLAVSNLESILKLYFVNYGRDPRNINLDNKKLDSIRVTLRELITEKGRVGGRMGSLILEKDQPSFQDLKTIKDTFETYYDKPIVLKRKDELAVCFYLESRHVIVHKGSIVDDKFIRATTSFGANLKSLTKGDTLNLDLEDWNTMRSALVELVRATTTPKQ